MYELARRNAHNNNNNNNNSLADRCPYDPLALLDPRDSRPRGIFNDASELLVKLSMSNPNSDGECENALLRLIRHAIDGHGLVIREPGIHRIAYIQAFLIELIIYIYNKL